MTSAAAISTEPLDRKQLRLINAYWCVANYLFVGQIYLLDNPQRR